MEEIGVTDVVSPVLSDGGMPLVWYKIETAPKDGRFLLLTGKYEETGLDDVYEEGWVYVGRWVEPNTRYDQTHHHKPMPAIDSGWEAFPVHYVDLVPDHWAYFPEPLSKTRILKRDIYGA
jgi:hypothetical protein